ncbi:hypothetical protein GCM10022297_06680 [Lactobacillus hamsteri]|nr:CAP domain-containing protein [Lactobacillus hamsteri]
MKIKKLLSMIAAASCLAMGGFVANKISKPATVQASVQSTEVKTFTNLLNQYRSKRGARKLHTKAWLTKRSKVRFNEFVRTFKKTGTLDGHKRPNGTMCFTAFGKYKYRISENEGYLYSSSTISPKDAATQLFDQFMYHDAGSHWVHRDNLRNKQARYLFVHFATVKKDGINNYLVMAHTGK